MRTAILDIETAPNMCYVWGNGNPMYQQNVIKFIKEWYILAFTVQWVDGETVTKALPDYKKTFAKDHQCDKAIAKELASILDEADVVVAHNGDGFDLRRINARILYWRHDPPSPYRTVDTLKIVRQRFHFNSNRLKDLGPLLGIGNKVDTGGFELWERCMAGDVKAFNTMKKYNQQDVVLEYDLYKVVLPFASKSHPNVSNFMQSKVCPKCGSSRVQSRGVQVLQTTRYQRYHCQDCGGWSRAYKRNKPSAELLVGV